jgi:hypothetical protein
VELFSFENVTRFNNYRSFGQRTTGKSYFLSSLQCQHHHTASSTVTDPSLHMSTTPKAAEGPGLGALACEFVASANVRGHSFGGDGGDDASAGPAAAGGAMLLPPAAPPPTKA